VAPPRAAIEATLFLIGDAGAPSSFDPVLSALETEVQSAVGSVPSTTVVYLGDNIYPTGMPGEAAASRREAERRLDAQVAAASAADNVYFVPGNHDWADAGEDGWEAILREGSYLEELGRASLLPEGGCPGPDVADLEGGVRLVMLDTQWWLHGGPVSGPVSTCGEATREQVTSAIEEAIASADGRHVVVAGHHPLRSSGPHGGRFGWMDHVFPLRAAAGWAWVPLPIIGSAYPLARMLGVTAQDLSNSRYETLVDAFEAAFEQEAPLIYAAGHEHGLEVHRGPGAEYTLVSGAGSSGQVSALRPSEETVFAMSANGFMRIDFYGDGRARLRVIAVEDNGTTLDSWTQWLN
jgi:hypothetical protein